MIIEGSVKLSQEELKITRTQAIPTPWGEPSAPFEFTEVEDKEIIVLPRHGRVCRKPPHLINYRANMWAIAQLAPKAVVALCSVGGIVEEDKPGSIAVPDQIIDYTWGRETSYNKGDSETITFIDFTEPFSEQLREKLLDAADDLLIPVIDGGTYAVRQGPRLETAAEIKKLAQDGAH
ncbi:MTAP family purine nucleoside phosphorylase, partial [Turicimonas muris]